VTTLSAIDSGDTNGGGSPTIPPGVTGTAAATPAIAPGGTSGSGGPTAGGRFDGVASGQQDDKPADQPRFPPGEAGELRARGSETPPGPPGAPVLSPRDRVPRPGPHNRHAPLLPEGAADMLGQQTGAPPVIVTLPAQLEAAAADQVADQITAAFTPGVSVVIADLTAAACCDRSAIRNLLKAHRKATVRGGQVRFAIRSGGPLHQLTGFADTHPLLTVYPTLQHALTGRSPIPPGNRAASGRAIADSARRASGLVSGRAGLIRDTTAATRATATTG
jgi:hypothetical protein